MRRLPDLRAVAARLPARPRTRFAPSPTGWLHLGHVVNALYTWGVAGALGGTVLLRIEDHDRERSRPEYERGILEDLAWLGLEGDGAGSATAERVPRQSEREAAYTQALRSLEGRGLVYACVCSRKQIERFATDAARELKYPGTCRERRLPLGPGAGLRVRFEPGVECFEDALMGAHAQDPAAQTGDLLIRDRLGGWTYSLPSPSTTVSSTWIS